MFAFFTPGPMELVVVGFVILLLFGNRMPSVMRSLGRSITEFKRGVRGVEENAWEMAEEVRSSSSAAGRHDDDDQARSTTTR